MLDVVSSVVPNSSDITPFIPSNCSFPHPPNLTVLIQQFSPFTFITIYSDEYRRSSSSPAPSLTSGKFGFLWFPSVQVLGVWFSLFCPLCRSSGPHSGSPLSRDSTKAWSFSFISTVVFGHLTGCSISSPSLDLVGTVLSSVMPPAQNSLTCSLGSQELKATLKKLIQSLVSQQQ